MRTTIVKSIKTLDFRRTREAKALYFDILSLSKSMNLHVDDLDFTAYYRGMDYRNAKIDGIKYKIILPKDAIRLAKHYSVKWVVDAIEKEIPPNPN